MDPRRLPPRGWLAAALLPVALANGCRNVPGERPTATFAALGPAAGAIEFREHGGPINLSDPLPGEGALTLPQAVARALRTDAGLQQALSRVRAAQAEAQQARLLPNPVLNVAFRFPERGGAPLVEAGLAADLLSLLQRPGRMRAADHRLRAASAEALAAALDLVSHVEERYLSVQSLEASIAAAQERRELLGRVRELAQARLRAGEGTRLETTTLDAGHAELDAEIAEQRIALADERLVLARLIGQPSGEAAWPVPPLQAPAGRLPPERAWIEAGLARRPEVQARRWELVALGDDLAAARWLPLEGGSGGIDSQRDGDWSVGPAVSVPAPFVDWGQARRTKLRAEQIGARHRLVEAQRQVVEEVRRAYLSATSLQAAAERLRSELLPTQERRREQTEAAYKAGQTDVTALLLADSDLHAAKARLVELHHKTARSTIKLRRAVGGGAVADSLTDAPAPSTAAEPR